jgi:hypothetical protein
VNRPGLARELARHAPVILAAGVFAGVVRCGRRPGLIAVIAVWLLLISPVMVAIALHGAGASPGLTAAMRKALPATGVPLWCWWRGIAGGVSLLKAP